MSVSLSVCLLSFQIRPLQVYLLSWMRDFSEIFLRHFWDIFPLFSNDYKLLVCLSVLQLAYFLTDIRLIQVYLLVWKSYLFEFFLETLLRYFQLCLCSLGKFGMEHPWTQASKFRKNQLGGPCEAHVWAIKGPSFVYFTVSLLLLVLNVSNFD